MAVSENGNCWTLVNTPLGCFYLAANGMCQRYFCYVVEAVVRQGLFPIQSCRSKFLIADIQLNVNRWQYGINVMGYSTAILHAMDYHRATDISIRPPALWLVLLPLLRLAASASLHLGNKGYLRGLCRRQGYFESGLGFVLRP